MRTTPPVAAARKNRNFGRRIGKTMVGPEHGVAGLAMSMKGVE
jgi:hypothetical protein